jgi:hypothetical protein
VSRRPAPPRRDADRGAGEGGPGKVGESQYQWSQAATIGARDAQGDRHYQVGILAQHETRFGLLRGDRGALRGAAANFGYKQIRASEVAETLFNQNCTIVQLTEGLVRPLTQLKSNDGKSPMDWEL